MAIPSKRARVEPTNPVVKAVRQVGGVTKAANTCLVSAVTVYVWQRQGYINKAKPADRLAEATGIDVRLLMGLEVKRNHNPKVGGKSRSRTADRIGRGASRVA